MSSDKQQYSLRNLEKLYTKLINQQPFSSPSSVNIPEILNQMGKIIVWGQRQKNGVENGDIFDFICEVKLFDLLLQIFTKCKNIDTINGVIGFYNMLLTNISKPETIMYLLSHPCILSMQLTKFGTMASQLAEYYINLLKGLSRKIDSNTIHIFFNKRYPNFPLLFQTIRFFNHPQNLVRTTSRNIILSVFGFSALRNSPQKTLLSQQKSHMHQNEQINSNSNNSSSSSQLLTKKLTSLHNYLTSFPFCIYYIHESNFIKEYWKILDQVLQPQGGEESIYENQQYEMENLDEILSDHEELLIYLDDLLAGSYRTKANSHNNFKNMTSLSPQIASKQRSFQEMFVSAFSNECLSELVMSMCSIKKAYLGIKTALLIFILLLNNIRNQFMSQTLIFTLFSKYYPKTITHKLLNPIDTLLSYNKEWKFKGFWDGHEDRVNEFCAKTFYQDKSLKSDVSKLNESVNQPKRKTNFANQAMSVFGVSPNYYQREVDKVYRSLTIFRFNAFSGQTFSNLCRYKINKLHNQNQANRADVHFSYISHSLLLRIHSFPPLTAKSGHFQHQPSKFRLKPSRLQHLLISGCKVFNQIYLQSKDDTLVMLTLCLLEKVFTTKNISQELISFCKLDVNPKTIDFASVITIEKIVLNCLRIFTVDPPNFRICTYKQAEKVFLHFIKLYQNQKIKLPKEVVYESKKAMKTAIDRITPYMYGGKQWEKVIELYLMINREGNKFRKNNLRTYGLIPDQMIHQTLNNNVKPKFTDDLYESIPRTFDQQIGRDLWIFIILKQLLSNMACSKSISKYLDITTNITPTKQSKLSKYDQGKSYSIEKDEHFKGFFKRTNEEKYRQCDVVLLGGYVVLGDGNKVEYKLPYEQSYMLIDKSDPRKLLLQSGNITISLQLENLKQALSMKDNFSQNKSLLLKCHLSNLIKEIQSLESQLK